MGLRTVGAAHGATLDPCHSCVVPGQAHVPPWQVLPPVQASPQLPPQPSSPQTLPAQLGVQERALACARHFLRFFLFLIFLQFLAVASSVRGPSSPSDPRNRPRSEERRVGKECRSRWSRE